MTAPDAPPTLESVLGKAWNQTFITGRDMRPAGVQMAAFVRAAAGAESFLVAGDGRLVVGAEQIATEVGMVRQPCDDCDSYGNEWETAGDAYPQPCRTCHGDREGHGSLFALPEKDHPTPPR